MTHAFYAGCYSSGDSHNDSLSRRENSDRGSTGEWDNPIVRRYNADRITTEEDLKNHPNVEIYDIFDDLEARVTSTKGDNKYSVKVELSASGEAHYLSKKMYHDSSDGLYKDHREIFVGPGKASLEISVELDKNLVLHFQKGWISDTLYHLDKCRLIHRPT